MLFIFSIYYPVPAPADAPVLAPADVPVLVPADLPAKVFFKFGLVGKFNCPVCVVYDTFICSRY